VDVPVGGRKGTPASIQEGAVRPDEPISNRRAYMDRAMTPLQTTVLMKTDIAGSTPRFRALLAADLQALVLEHREFIAQHAAVEVEKSSGWREMAIG
jgi:hypothetical protein